VLREAVALDSGFAMAYRKLAVAIGNSGGSREDEYAAATRAYQLRDRLPAVERELATAYYHAAVDANPVLEVETYRSLLRREPDNESALNNLALVLSGERRFAEAESLGLRALRVGSSDVDLYYDKVIFAQVGQGRIEEARNTAARAATVLPPGSPGRREFPALVALAERDHETADSLYRHLRREQEGNLELEALAVNALASLAVTRGRLEDAVRLRNEQRRIASIRGLPRDYILASAQIARLERVYRNRPAEAIAQVQTALARYPLDSMSPLDRPYLPLAAVYADAGLLDQARRLLREYESVVPAGVRRGDRAQGLA